MEQIWKRRTSLYSKTQDGVVKTTKNHPEITCQEFFVLLSFTCSICSRSIKRFIAWSLRVNRTQSANHVAFALPLLRFYPNSGLYFSCSTSYLIWLFVCFDKWNWRNHATSPRHYFGHIFLQSNFSSSPFNRSRANTSLFTIIVTTI